MDTLKGESGEQGGPGKQSLFEHLKISTMIRFAVGEMGKEGVPGIMKCIGEPGPPGPSGRSGRPGPNGVKGEKGVLGDKVCRTVPLIYTISMSGLPRVAKASREKKASKGYQELRESQD